MRAPVVRALRYAGNPPAERRHTECRGGEPAQEAQGFEKWEGERSPRWCSPCPLETFTVVQDVKQED